MESPSANVPVVFQNEKKLKQATLPFGIIKVNSKTNLNNQNLNAGCKVEDNDDSVEFIDEIKVCGKQSLSKHDSSEMEVEETTPESVPEFVNEVPEGKDEINKKESNKGGLIENSGKVDVDNSVSKYLKSSEDDNMKSNKRKLENAEQMKESKPPKRAKLIYHVDKIIQNKNSSVSNVNSVNTVCDNMNKPEEKTSSDSLVTGNAAVSNLKSVVKGEVNECREVENDTTIHGMVLEESHMTLKGGNNSKTEVNGSTDNEKCSVENMDVDGLSVEVLTPVEKSEKSSEENFSSPGVKGEKCSPSEKGTVKQLTPKQLERRAEVLKRREEIQQERERKKKEKDRKKQEKEEEKARLKQEKEEVRKKMKEEKEKKKLAEIEMKNEEKRKKEEERRKKEEEKQEEKRKKEEQKLEDKRKKEEEMQKKKITKEAVAFSSFFKKCDSKTPTVRDDDRPSNEITFMPFVVRADMRLAPVNRNPMDDERRSKFEELFGTQSVEITYLEEFRSGIVVPKKSSNTWPLEEKYEEVVVLDEGLDINDGVTVGPEKKFNDRRPKLLQFYENRRPPYWGTWRKKSKNIRPKNPLGRDEIFDYEVDSDDEWEEEEPGESLHGSDDEKESEDEYEVDNDFFVPHGYLSDDENPEEETISPETQKAKLKLLGEQFDMERNEKTKLLKPILLGCIWFDNDADEPASANPSVVRFLNKRKAVPWTENIPIPVLQDENTDPSDVMLSDGGTPTNHSVKETLFPESAVRDLITLVHCSTNSRKNLAKTFLTQWNKKQEDSVSENEVNSPLLSQARIARKIKELAKWEEFPEEGPFNGKFCWYVKKEVREKFGLADLFIHQKVDDISDLDGCKKVSPSLITKFTKVLTEDERRNQITKARKSLTAAKPLSESTPNTPKQAPQLKCFQKLKEFWAKPSIISKYTPTATVDNDEVMVIEPSKDDNQVASDNSASDCEIMEITSENLSSTDKTVSVESSKVETLDSNIKASENASCEVKQMEAEKKPKKKVPILFSVPRGCEIVKPVAELKIPVISIDIDVENTGQSSRDETLNDSKAAADSSKCELKDTCKDYEKQPEILPKPKKRVAILFSAPRGCEIVKPVAEPKKSEISLNNETGKPAESSKEVNSANNEGLSTETTSTFNECAKQPEAVEKPKKRATILFSAPLGSEIVNPKKPAISTEDVKVSADPRKVEEPDNDENAATGSRNGVIQIPHEFTEQPEVVKKPKKRVPILFSAPIGSEIVKPEIPRKKPLILTEDVKEYAACSKEETVAEESSCEVIQPCTKSGDESEVDSEPKKMLPNLSSSPTESGTVKPKVSMDEEVEEPMEVTLVNGKEDDGSSSEVVQTPQTLEKEPEVTSAESNETKPLITSEDMPIDVMNGEPSTTNTEVALGNNAESVSKDCEMMEITATDSTDKVVPSELSISETQDRNTEPAASTDVKESSKEELCDKTEAVADGSSCEINQTSTESAKQPEEPNKVEISTVADVEMSAESSKTKRRNENDTVADSSNCGLRETCKESENQPEPDNTVAILFSGEIVKPEVSIAAEADKSTEVRHDKSETVADGSSSEISQTPIGKPEVGTEPQESVSMPLECEIAKPDEEVKNKSVEITNDISEAVADVSSSQVPETCAESAKEPEVDSESTDGVRVSSLNGEIVEPEVETKKPLLAPNEIALN